MSTGARRESASRMRKSTGFVIFHLPSIISPQGSRCGHVVVFRYRPSTVCMAHVWPSKNAGGTRFRHSVLIEIFIQPTNTHVSPQSCQLRFWLSGPGSKEVPPNWSVTMVEATRKHNREKQHSLAGRKVRPRVRQTQAADARDGPGKDVAGSREPG